MFPSWYAYTQQQRLATSNPRRSSGGNYEYPDPTHMAPVSPASSSTSYHTAPYPPQPQQQPYYPPPQVPRRSSPQSAYSYDARASGSPPGNNTSTPPSYPSFPGGLHPPQVLPPTLENVRTPPPGQPREGAGNGNGSRPGMSVRDMLGPGENSQSGQGARSSADSDMLKALSRRGM